MSSQNRVVLRLATGVVPVVYRDCDDRLVEETVDGERRGVAVSPRQERFLDRKAVSSDEEQP